MRALLLLALAGAASLACAPRYVETEPGPEGETVVIGTVGPDGTYRADTLSGAVPDTARVERESVTTGTIRPAAPEMTTGWRVQVFADTDRAAAEAFAEDVAPLADGHPVYVEWAEPWWKVRIGDFLDPADADALRERLAAAGFEDAWAVRTTVRAGG